MDFDAQPILLTEDNDDDVFIFRRAFKQAGLKNPLHIAVDGQEAVDYLAGAGRFADRARHPLPYLVVLDLKLPLRNGLEVLEWMRSRQEFARTPVVILTSSAELRDLAGARELGARHYLVKPPRTQTLVELMEILRAEYAGLPPPRSGALEADLFTERKGAAGSAVPPDRGA
jgi:CheY-like chemotaxis protein